MAKNYFFFLTILLLFFSCKKDNVIDSVDFGRDYFPGKIGTYVVYECDSTVYPDLNAPTRNYKFFIKEVIDSNFKDNSGSTAIKISRFKKWTKYDTVTLADTSWYLQDVWWGNISNEKFELVEENNRVIKLVFPVEQGKTWNGNAFNTLGEWEFEYTSVDVPYSNGYKSFEKTLHVNQFDSGNILLYYKNYNEKYARGVGMIFKEIEDYTWQENNGTILVGSIKYGLHYTMKAIDFGP
ncbi:MAG: hypothetical protein ACK5D5_10425 [Bacteroidota bacterium]|jgi:hypothetical protein